MRLVSITVTIIGLLIYNTAWASKARLGALAQGTDGSLYIDDPRNVLLNPALITQQKNQVSFELGTTSVNTGTNPKADGSLYLKGESFSYGVFLGRNNNATEYMIYKGDSSELNIDFLPPQESVEFIMGGELSDLNWGGSVHYASAENNTGSPADLPKDKATLLTLRGGVAGSSYTAFAAYDLVFNSSKDLVGGGTQEFDGGLNLELGGAYTLSADSKLGTEVSIRNFDFKSGGANDGESSMQAIGVNYYRTVFTDLKTKSMLFYTAGLGWVVHENKFSAPASISQKKTSIYIPLTFGVEAEVATWITLRGSVRQNVLIDSVELRHDTANNTETKNIGGATTSAGVSMYFDKFTVDANFEGSNTGDLDGNELLADASLTYSF